jgi:tetratricopeptide (TPR) repeat protein
MATQLISVKILAIVVALGLLGIFAANPTGLFTLATQASLNIVAQPTSIAEGGSANFQLSFNDIQPYVNPYGVYGRYSVRWDFGDGNYDLDYVTADSAPYALVLNKQHTYVESGQHFARATIRDETTRRALMRTIVIDVANLPPAVALDAIDLGNGDWKLVSTYKDPGILDTHVYTIDFGDGTLDGPHAAPTVSGAGTITTYHHYEGGGAWSDNPCSENPGRRVLTASIVIDDEGAEGRATKEIVVSSPPPSYEERVAWARDLAASLGIGKGVVGSLDRALLEASTGPGLPVSEPDSPQHNYIKSFDRVRKASHIMRRTVAAEKEKLLCALNHAVRDKAKERLGLAISQVGLGNKDVAKAQQKYDEGLGLLLAAKYDEAINKFKESLSKATKAISKDILFSYSDELEFSMGDVDGLLGTDVRADKELNKIIDTITKAGREADRDKFQEATEHIKQAIDDLQKVQQKFGIAVSQVTTDMVLDIELAASLKLSEAEQIVVGPERSSVKSAQALSDGSALREAGDYKRAIEKFQEAYREASKAIKEGGKPAQL